MSARDELRKYVHLLADSWTPRETTDARVERLYGLVRAEVIAERDAMTVAWLVKKAREFRAMGGRMRAAQADAVAAMASKVERGAIRPDNLRTLPADFFEPGHTYRDDAYGWAFRVDTVTTHPDDGARVALGWRFFKGRWEPIAYGEDDWDVHQHIGYSDVTEDGDAR